MLKYAQKLSLAGLALAICILIAFHLFMSDRKAAPARSTARTCVQLRAEMEQLSCSDTIANDWGELDRYREANAQIPEAKAGQPRIVFIGDSITSEWPALGVPGRFAGVDVINRGIAGQLTSQMLLRFRQDVIDLHPQVVVILGGSNDIARVLSPALPIVEGNLASMAQLAKANGIRAILSSIPPVNNYELDPKGKPYPQMETHSPQQIRKLNDWIRKFAKDNDCLFLDYYSALVDGQGFLRKGYSVDGLHPNAAGYAVMERSALQAIRAATR